MSKITSLVSYLLIEADKSQKLNDYFSLRNNGGKNAHNSYSMYYHPFFA